MSDTLNYTVWVPTSARVVGDTVSVITPPLVVVDKVVAGDDWVKEIVSEAPGSGSDTAGTVWV